MKMRSMTQEVVVDVSVTMNASPDVPTTNGASKGVTGVCSTDADGDVQRPHPCQGLFQQDYFSMPPRTLIPAQSDECSSPDPLVSLVRPLHHPFTLNPLP
jgi:hypothetical protein